MLHIKLGERRTISSTDVMGRDWFGYDPAVPVEQLFEMNRGIWVVGSRANQERLAVFSYTGDHKVKFVAEINGFESFGKRRAILGHVLSDDDPRAQGLVGASALDGHRNPVTYIAEDRTCGCGCGGAIPPSRLFLPGHDQKAVRERITEKWGSTIGFINWFDATYRAD